MSADVTTAAAPASRQLAVPNWARLAVIWALLIAAPYWLPLFGGYTALAGRVLVFGLAAMGLNLLLGFTGVLSFGHAAYFGLGAYGAGLTLRYLVHSTPIAMLAGTLLGGLAGTLFGLLIVRRRGVYFAMCTIAFGQLWYYLAYSWNDFTGGFDGLRDFHREPIGFGSLTSRHYRGRAAILLFPAGSVRDRRDPARPAGAFSVRSYLAGDPGE